MCKYYFRRNVTDFPNTRDLDSINIDLVEKSQKKIADGKKLSYAFLSQSILSGKGQPAKVDALREKLLDNLFDNNEYMARYALIKLDEANHSNEYAPNLWERNEKGLYVWTVEHVFPQGKNIPAEWIKMIGKGNKEMAEKIQGECVHSLGNLTLSGYNSKLSDFSFARKQEKTEVNILGRPLQIGYKNGLTLNNIEYSVDDRKYSLATAKEWTKEHIEARNKAMVDMLVKLFKFENE